MSFNKIFFLILFTLPLFSQTKEVLISGLVLDASSKMPLEGASVLIEGTKKGAITNSKGEFFYTVKSDNPSEVVLIISYLGYETEKVKLGNKVKFNILMRDSTKSLQEIVITSSYGTKKLKEESVASITTVKSEDLQVNQAVESFDKMLEGAAAGVLISGTSDIGGGVKIDIRGQGTLTPLNANLIGTSTQPLIIIDGIIMKEESGFDNLIFDGAGTLSESFMNPLAKISPEDIENITILKDAAAVGLYGADAANGVILVTTKKGKTKNLLMSFQTQTGTSNPINQIRYLSGPQYHEIYREYLISQGQSPQQATINAGSSTINTDWFGLLNRPGYFQRYGLNASFGIGKLNFRASWNTLKNNEPQLNNDYTRHAFSINSSYTSNKLQATLLVSPSWIVKNSPNTLFNFPLAPNISPFDADGNFSLLGFAGFGNPLAVANQNWNESTTNGVLTSLNLLIPIHQNWKLSSVSGIDYSLKNQNRYFSAFNESGQFNGTFTLQQPDGSSINYPNWGRRLNFSRNGLRWNQSMQVQFEKKFNKNKLDALLGFELSKERIDNTRELGTGFVNPGPINNATDASGRYQKNTYLSENARRSLFLQINHDYNKKWYSLINIRRDESSAFGSDKNVAWNGAFGAGWNLSNENWLKNENWLDFFRFRTSYGVTGNSRIGPYRSLGLYNVDIIGDDGYNGNGVATPATPPNPNLTWEKNYKFNFGIDFNFLKIHKIVVDVFHDNITDMIISANVPLETGFSSIQINGSSMYNRGIEFTYNTTPLQNERWKWSSNFNISFIQNKVTELKGVGSPFSASERARAQKVGFPTSAFWGVKFAGIDPATGRELFWNNGQLYDAATYNSLFGPNDWQIIGNSQPDFFGGFNNTVSFNKQWSLTIRTSFNWGADILIADELESQYRVLVNRNLSVNVLDRWQQQGDVSLHPQVTPNNPIIQNSSKFLYDTSHIRIQNINLSYQFPINKLNQKWLKGLQIFMDVSNVWYWYKNQSPKGRNGVAEYRFLYPEARTFTFGVQTNF
jgi:TonB-linked SusC/RagA family outer membrane protein